MEIPRHWRLKKQRYNLVGTIDPKTGGPEFPPKNHPKKEVVIFSSSKLPSYTSGSYTEVQETPQPLPVQ